MRQTSMLAVFAVFLCFSTARTLCGQDQNQVPPDQQKSVHDTHSTAQAAPPYKDIEDSIKQAIKEDPQMAHSRVGVHVSHDEVILRGVVASKEAEQRALQIATDKAGSRKVRDLLKVNPNLHPGPGM